MQRPQSWRELDLLEEPIGSQWVWKKASKEVHDSKGIKEVSLCRPLKVKLRIQIFTPGCWGVAVWFSTQVVYHHRPTLEVPSASKGYQQMGKGENLHTKVLTDVSGVTALILSDGICTF